MRKLLLLIVILIMTSPVFSQNDTPILLPQKTAKEIIKDLLEGDAAKEENLLLKKKINLYELKTSYTDSIISSLNKKIENFQIIINNQDSQIGLYKDLNTQLKNDLKKQKFTSKIYKSSTLLVIIGGLVYIISSSQ